jgi:hypothetical protein
MQKLILEIKSTGETKSYKTLRAIAKDLNIDYYHLRSVYYNHKNPKKFLHPITAHYNDQYKIYDNPEIFKH